MRDGIPENADRAGWAKAALVTFIEETGGRGIWADETGEDGRAAICDLICDLLHLAEQRGYGAIECAKHGLGMWSAENRHPFGNPHINDDADIFITNRS